jgi:hypothetical protein
MVGGREEEEGRDKNYAQLEEWETKDKEDTRVARELYVYPRSWASLSCATLWFLDVAPHRTGLKSV